MRSTTVIVWIVCTACHKQTRAHNGPAPAGRSWRWQNECTECGAVYPAPSSREPEARALERAGQQRLFPE